MSTKMTTSRRNFLQGSLAAGAGVALASQLSVARTAHAAGSDVLKVVLIGCGGRGQGAIRDCMNADKNVKVIAVADAFEDRAKGAADGLRKEEGLASRVDLPDDRVFVGLDAYQKAIDCDPDMVIIATPPGFRPMQYAAAVKAGKHVFMEKPCCVDAPGYNSLVETNKLADEKGLKVGVGLQRHHQQSYVETIKRIHDGAIGDIMFLRAYWNGSGIWNRNREPNMTEMQYQVHNWYHFVWLSGDNICEQHVHNLDVCNWVKNDHPVEANGMGGCTRRYHGRRCAARARSSTTTSSSSPTRTAPRCSASAATWPVPGTKSSEAAHGTKGESNCASCDQGSRRMAVSAAITPNPYVQEHVDLIAAIRGGEKYNEGWFGATSSMTAVLGRMATYSGKVVKWDEAIKEGVSTFPKELSWDAAAPVQKDENGDYPIAVPGVSDPYKWA